jgi:hypothetical protein
VEQHKGLIFKISPGATDPASGDGGPYSFVWRNYQYTNIVIYFDLSAYNLIDYILKLFKLSSIKNAEGNYFSGRDPKNQFPSAKRNNDPSTG